MVPRSDPYLFSLYYTFLTDTPRFTLTLNIKKSKGVKEIFINMDLTSIK